MEVSRRKGDRAWEELLPEALDLIFKKMSFEEVLTVVPAVCKSWRKVATHPDFWQEIDIEEWCRPCTPETRDRMVTMLVSRSGASMRKLSVCELTNDPIFAFIAGCAHSLETQRMPWSQVTDSIVIQVAPKLASVTYLDISYCKKMTSSSLEALGTHCKFLTRLTRIMNYGTGQILYSPEDEEGFAIAQYMSGLKHLELAFSVLTDAGVKAILSLCKDLEHLDIRGCSNVHLQDSLAVQCQKLKVFMTHDDFTFDDYKFDDYKLDDLFRDLRDIEPSPLSGSIDEEFFNDYLEDEFLN